MIIVSGIPDDAKHEDLGNGLRKTSWSIPASAFEPAVKVKELRLGNWLQSYYIMNDGFGNITKEGIKPFQVDLKTLETLTSSQALWATMEPIPLTEDWLNKLGFVQRITRIDEYSTLRITEDGRFEILDISDGQFVSSHDCCIKFVHQLQNLFHSLSGEELTIINL